MKVIFLDHDGVICLSDEWGGRFKKEKKFREETGILAKLSSPHYGLPVECRFDNFNKKAIDVLNEILETTGAEIVVSSDWKRWANVEEMGEYYLSQGICKKPIATTDMFKDIFPSEWAKLRFRADLELERSMEIQHWLENHSEVTHWVAVDDLNMSVEFLGVHFASKDGSEDKPGLTNFVWTPNSNEGIKQSGVKEKILNFLL